MSSQEAAVTATSLFLLRGGVQSTSRHQSTASSRFKNKAETVTLITPLDANNIAIKGTLNGIGEYRGT